MVVSVIFSFRTSPCKMKFHDSRYHFMMIRDSTFKKICFHKTTISHISYWDQVNTWKNLWKFWNGPLCRNKSGPFPLLNFAAYCKSNDTKACVKNLSHILASNIDNGGKEIGIKTYARYCLKKQMKNKRGFQKTWHSFKLKLIILDDWGMSNSSMTNWVTPWSLWPSKKWSVGIMGKYNGFLSLKVDILSTQSVLFFLVCYTATAPISFMNLFYEIHY